MTGAQEGLESACDGALCRGLAAAGQGCCDESGEARQRLRPAKGDQELEPFLEDQRVALEQGEGRNRLRMGSSEGQGTHAAGRMAGEGKPGEAEVLGRPSEVVDHCREGVVAVARPAALTMPAKIEGKRAAGGAKLFRDLVPRFERLPVAVKQDDRWKVRRTARAGTEADLPGIEVAIDWSRVSDTFPCRCS